MDASPSPSQSQILYTLANEVVLTGCKRRSKGSSTQKCKHEALRKHIGDFNLLIVLKLKCQVAFCVFQYSEADEAGEKSQRLVMRFHDS